MTSSAGWAGSGVFRPHLEGDPECWCKPIEDECDNCGHKHYIHHDLEPLPDVQPRLMVFSR